jgi:hypothetical protein
LLYPHKKIRNRNKDDEGIVMSVGGIAIYIRAKTVAEIGPLMDTMLSFIPMNII